jgi:N-acyl-D-amino-acid deacylase
VTSVVAGNCGGSTINVAESFQRIRDTGISVNFATLVGHNSVRMTHMRLRRTVELRCCKVVARR